MDDSAFVSAENAQRIVGATSVVCRIIMESFHKYRLPINFKVGKTEVVIHFQGRGSQAARATFWGESDGKIAFNHAGAEVAVHTTDAYKH